MRLSPDWALMWMATVYSSIPSSTGPASSRLSVTSISSSSKLLTEVESNSEAAPSGRSPGKVFPIHPPQLRTLWMRSGNM
eukprot:scaffold362871_cov33-Prasinocladus_malaysianus.AAC.1